MDTKKSCCTTNRSSNIQVNNELISKYKPKSPPVTDGMVLLKGGLFLMGSNEKETFPEDGEGPVREVEVSSFYIDECTITNEKFKRFVTEAGYKTEAEKFGWSFVFDLFVSSYVKKNHVKQAVHGTPWWLVVEGADWSHPEGPDSSIDNRMDHPVVHVSWNDAMAYCSWSGKRLPNEAEWEYAARGGLVQKRYPWGDRLHPNGKHFCNIWQGTFPKKNHGKDGFIGTAPSKSFPPNGYGLYNLSGNVWEWCSDWFSTNHQASPSIHLEEALTGRGKVIKGGSYLCHKSYCNRYRVAARTAVSPDSSSGHMGFRCAMDAQYT